MAIPGVPSTNTPIKPPLETGGRAVQTAGKAVQGAGKVAELGGRGFGSIGSGAVRAGQGLSNVGKSLSSTKLGSLVGAPLSAWGSVTKGIGQATKNLGDVTELGGKMAQSAGRGPQPETKPGEIGARKSQFAKNRIPNTRRDSDINRIMQTGSSQTPREPLQTNAQRSAKLRSDRMQSQMNPLQRSQTMNAERNTQTQKQEENEEESEQQEEGGQRPSFQSMMNMSRIKGLLAEEAGIKQQKENRGSEKAALAETQDAAKKAAKKLIPKAANMLVNSLSTGLDVGTEGIGLLVTIFVHILSLGWWNVEMVYGTWIKKGKDPIVGALTWDPIPMFIDKEGLMLQVLVIAADLALIVLVIISFAIQALLLLLMFSPMLLIGYLGWGAIGELITYFK